MMKTYLWIMHLASGGFGLLASLLEGAFEETALFLILFSVVALLCLVFLYGFDSKIKS